MRFSVLGWVENRLSMPWPVKGSVLARFGQLRAGGPLKWQGMVIGAERGAQVRAPFPGWVVYADWLPGMGLLIVLDHGGAISIADSPLGGAAFVLVLPIEGPRRAGRSE